MIKIKNNNGKEVSLDDFKGKWLIIYFYPKDDTPGCTMEGIEFTKNLSKFTKLNSIVIGISPDSEESHCKFAEKHKLEIELLSDPDKKVIKEFGVWGKKNLYGKEYEGVIRSTFILNPNGEIVADWKNVKVPGHVDQVLIKLRELQNEIFN